jgi:hypothetical protein
MIEKDPWLRHELKELERKKESHLLRSVRDIANRCRLRVEKHDPYTKEHSVRVAMWSKIIANRLPTFDKRRKYKLEITALVHDYGKLKVPYDILNKPSKLTEEEFEEIKKHPLNGARMLESFIPYIAIEGVLYHHVRFEGGGYPYTNLSGYEVPLEARIIAVGDTFDAMTSDRSYRKGMKPEKALEIMNKVSGKQLDHNLVRIFERYYNMEKMTKGYSVGAQTMILSASVDEEVRRAKEYLQKKIGDYDRRNPLGKVTDREAFIQDAVDYLVGLAVDRKTADKFVRYAYKMPLKETFDRQNIALSDSEYEDLVESTQGKNKGHKEITLPLKKVLKEYQTMEIAVFNQKLWKCIGDGRNMVLLR